MNKREPHDNRKRNALKAALFSLIVPVPWGLPHAGSGIVPSGLIFIVALQNSFEGRGAGELWIMALVMWGIPFLGLFIVFELVRKWNERGST